MIRHIVFIRFKPEMTDAKIFSIFDGLYDIKDKLPGVLSITSGKSKSPEQMERGYMHGFVVDFTDWDALQTYQDHPDHKLLGGKLVANAVAGIDDILVFDLSVPQ